MKNLLLAACVLFTSISISVNAQITITRADFPEIGNLVVSAVDNTTTVDPGQPGLNQVWNFGNLVASSYDSVYYISPSGAPGYQNYPNANIVSNHNPAQFPGGYNINFWNFSDTDIKGIADESLANLFGSIFMAFHIHYLPPPAQISFPFTYGSSKIQDFVMDFVIAFRNGGVTTDSSRTVNHVHLDYLADAAGTLVIPDGSFPVIRVKETWQSVDTSFTWTGNAWVYDSDTVSNWTQYRWYANDYGEVGFYSSNSKKANGFTFFKSETITGLGQLPDRDGFAVYPNPASGSIRIVSDKPADNVEILDNAGKSLIHADHQSVIDVSSLSTGLYIIRIHCGNTIHSEKFYKL